MRKLLSRFLSLGTGTDQISARTFLAGFTPTNYTPTETASEGTGKVSAHLNGLDSRVGAVAANTLYFVDEFFDGNGVASQLSLSSDIGTSTPLDVYADGVLYEEDVSSGPSYSRDASGNKVVWKSSGVESPVPSGARIRVRVWFRGT